MSRALGRYELLRPLARGGMAEVYLARRRAAGVEKWLVVKRMRPERAGDARFLDLFVREARLSMSLAHQNIVPVFDFGRIDDQVFLAMERVEGKDLGASLAKAPLPPLVAAFVAAECCQALDYAHLRRGPDGRPLEIVHRDVTPRNVLLSWSGEVKLTDFGIAAMAGDDPTKVIGTPAYMAPEQARGEQVDPRADVYAVGLILREALTGVRARRGEDRETTLAAARAGELGAWPTIVAGIPAAAALVAIADRATSTDPAARYTNARDMLAALDTYIVGERAKATDDAPARQLADWLVRTWGAAHDGEDAADGDVNSDVGSHLVSFLDDGALDVIGTGTARSMAATEADAADAEAQAVAKPSPDPAAPPTAAAAAPTTKRPALWLAGGALLAIGGVALAMQRDTKPAPATKPEAVAKPAAIVDEKPAPTAKPDPVAAPQPLADPKPTPVDKPTPITAKPAPVKKPAGTPAPSPSATTSAASPPLPPPSADLHRVIVNVAPGWAYFTVDGDATQFQTLATVKLPAGAHTIHFAQGDTHRDVPITVPDDDQLKVLIDLSR